SRGSDVRNLLRGRARAKIAAWSAPRDQQAPDRGAVAERRQAVAGLGQYQNRSYWAAVTHPHLVCFAYALLTHLRIEQTGAQGQRTRHSCWPLNRCGSGPAPESAVGGPEPPHLSAGGVS